jgi:N-terminal domain of galactosyltransferase
VTSPRIQICVPFRAGDAGRAEGWAYNLAFWERTRWPISVADSDPEHPFNRSQARNRAAAYGAWDVAVFADACIFVADPYLVQRASAMAARLGRLVHGHTAVRRLTQRGTAMVLANRSPGGAEVLRRNGPRTPGGVLAVPRRLFERTGGWDESFEGWGAEDNAFVAACLARTGGARINVPGTVYHLWHAHSDRAVDSDAFARNRKRAAAAWARAG